MCLDPGEYQRSLADYLANWRRADNALYDFVSQDPNHTSMATINAKLLIIGRAYATGIERQIPRGDGGLGSLPRLGRFFHDNSATIDAILGELATVTEPLDAGKLANTIRLHGRFVSLLQHITRDHKSPRSFVAKYMHFHYPAVPLYDDRAARALRHRCHWRPALQIFNLPNGADEEYYRHVLRFWHVYQAAQEAGVDLSVMKLDKYLLWVAEGIA